MQLGLYVVKAALFVDPWWLLYLARLPEQGGPAQGCRKALESDRAGDGGWRPEHELWPIRPAPRPRLLTSRWPTLVISLAHECAARPAPSWSARATKPPTIWDL